MDSKNVTIPLEIAGEKKECVVISIFEVNGKKHIALLPEGADEIFLYEFIEVTGEEDVIEIKNIDESEYPTVAEVFDRVFISTHSEEGKVD